MNNFRFYGEDTYGWYIMAMWTEGKTFWNNLYGNHWKEIGYFWGVSVGQNEATKANFKTHPVEWRTTITFGSLWLALQENMFCVRLIREVENFLVYNEYMSVCVPEEKISLWHRISLDSRSKLLDMKQIGLNDHIHFLSQIQDIKVLKIFIYSLKEMHQPRFG